jgi:hypothetical protein
MTDLDGLNGARDLVAGLFVFVKAVRMHGPRHPAIARQAEILAGQVEAARPPLSLQFVAGGVFRNRSLVPLEAESFRKADFLTQVFDELRVQELSFDAVPTPEALQLLAVALGQPSSPLEDTTIPGMRFREIPSARFGLENEQVDIETFVAAQLSLALGSIERALKPDGTWAWDLGLAAVRRIDRAVEVGALAALRIIEEMPGPWTAARLATSAALTTATSLRALTASVSTRRSATHATLILSCCGFRDSTTGLDPAAATDLGLAHAVRAPLPKGNLDPHRLRACALLQLYSSSEPEQRDGLCGLLSVAYGLERLRVRPGVPFTLMRQDLLAQAVRQLDAPYPSLWVRVLVAANGAVPAGSRVRLADGRLVTVLGPGTSGDPLRPEVLLDGRRQVPEARVTLVPPGARA